MRRNRNRRTVAALIIIVSIAVAVYTNPNNQQLVPTSPSPPTASVYQSAAQALDKLETKGRSAKTGYTRTQYGAGWARIDGCDTRNLILLRDLEDTVTSSDCKVISGTLADPYTGKQIDFRRGAGTSGDVQIDHVVALSDSWQKGASGWTLDRRIKFANDPLELLAVDGAANQTKSGSDAATWLPPSKVFRCQYVARQIAVKSNYGLWVTQAEREAMLRVLSRCPQQALPMPPSV